MRLRLSRAVAVAVATPLATATLVTVSMPAAHATVKNHCAYDPVIDGSTRIRACIQGVEGEEPTVKPWARMRFASPDASKWESCTVIVALFIDGQKRTDKETSCLAWALTGTSSSPEVVTFSGWTTRAYENNQYKGVARWYGVYDGRDVGSHVNSHSPQVSFVRLTGLNLTDESTVPGVVDNPPVPGAVEPYVYEPAVPVELGV